jgi:hypothetical protein
LELRVIRVAIEVEEIPGPNWGNYSVGDPLAFSRSLISILLILKPIEPKHTVYPGLSET